MSVDSVIIGRRPTEGDIVISAQAVAIESRQSETLVGTTLVGFTTSFPEIAATVAALLGEDYCAAVPQAAKPIADVLPKKN